MVGQYLSLVVTVLIVLVLIPVLDGIERKFVRARIQSRVGPPVLQTYYDLIKLFRKELLIPSTASKLFFIAPILSFFTSVAALFVIPYTLSNPLGFEGDLILFTYLLIFSSVTALLGGLASGNPFTEVSSSRELSLLIASELFLGLSIAVIALKHSSLSLSKIASTPVVTPSVILAYIALLYYAFVKSARTPYDIAEAEPEIASGYLIEYSGPLLAFAVLSNLVRRYLTASFFVVVALGPTVSLATSPIPTPIKELTNYVLVLVLSVLTYLALGTASVVHGRFRVIHALDSIRKYTSIPIIALLLAVVGL